MKGYTDAFETHLVVYDDGDQRNEALNDPLLSWQLLEPSPSAPPPRSAGPPPHQLHAKPKLPKLEPKSKLEPKPPKPKAKAARAEPPPSLPTDAKPGRKPAKRPRAEAVAKPSAAAAAAVAAAAAPRLWPGGGTWTPSTQDWGTRAPGAFGCGKCRWHPKGCRGCIAAAASFVPAAVAPLPRGEVALPRFKVWTAAAHTASASTLQPCPPTVLPSLPGREHASTRAHAHARTNTTLPPAALLPQAHAHVYAHTEGPDEAGRQAAVRELQTRLRVQGGAAQSDPAGHGVVAAIRLRKGKGL